MSNYVVSYDLIEDKNYEAIIEKIKSLGSWAKPLESFWLLDSSKSASEIRDLLQTVVDQDDKIIVIQLGDYWATNNISKEVTKWMKKHI
jgi:autonomous glycyl radical cofactor GrcA